MFGALKCGFQNMASLMLVRTVVGELQPKRTLAASRGFLAAARLSCLYIGVCAYGMFVYAADTLFRTVSVSALKMDIRVL